MDELEQLEQTGTWQYAPHWSEEDERARMEHRKALAARPISFGMADAVLRQKDTHDGA